MHDAPTEFLPDRTCQRCGTKVPRTEGHCCPLCLERDLQAAPESIFEPQPGLHGRLEGSGFTILEEIGHGGMGVVFRARQDSPARDVAVKVLQPHLVSSPDLRRRLLAEAAAMAELNHPGILPLYAAGEHNGQPWLAMKLAPGKSLSLRRGEWLGRWRPVAELLASLADAVHHAHERGLIHRDVKPGNVLFDEHGRACLADFGLVKWLDAEITDTLSNALLGTPAYLPPEVAQHGARAATTASDIYGLGAILYELLSGAPPFKGAATAELLQRIAKEEPPPPRRLVPGIPADLETICLKAIAKDPARRYPSAADFAADLRRWLDGRIIMARRFSVTERVLRWARHNPLPASLAAALALALMAGGITIGTRNRALRSTNSALSVSLVEAKRARVAAENRVSYMTRELPPVLEPLGRLDVMNGIFENVREYYDGPGAATDAAGLARQSDFLVQWARVIRLQGRRPEARAMLDEAVVLARKAVAIPPAGAEVQIAQAEALRCRGEHAVMEDDLATAGRLTLEAVEAAARAAQEFPDDPSVRAQLAACVNEQAYAAHESEDFAAAHSLLNSSLALWRALGEQTVLNDPILHLRARREVAGCLFALGRAAEARNDHSAALAYFRESHALRVKLAEDYPDSAEERRQVAGCCNRVAGLLLQSSRTQREPPPAESEALLNQAESLLADLVKQDPANQRWRVEWGMAAQATAHLEAARGDADASRRSLEETLRRFGAAKPTAHELLVETRAWTLHYLALNAAAAGDHSSAQAHWRQALETTMARLSTDPRRAAHVQWKQILQSSAEHGMKHEPAAKREADLRVWLAKAMVEAGKPGAAPWWKSTIAALHRRLADLCHAEKSREAESTAENRAAFLLRAELLAGEPRATEDLIAETTGAAGKLLTGLPSGEDRLVVASRLIACAPRAALLQPDGSWRSEWANIVCFALKPLAASQRAEVITAVRKALYPDPPPRPWSREEFKGLDQLRKFEAADATSPSPQTSDEPPH